METDRGEADFAIDAKEVVAEVDNLDKRQAVLRALPSVGSVLELEQIERLTGQYSRDVVRTAIRECLEEMRRDVGREELRMTPNRQKLTEILLQRVESWLDEHSSPSLQRVINATGVILHTNMGRAVLPARAIAAVKSVATGYSNLELDLDSGSRGYRQDHVRSLLARLTGAEDALVVNNNAGAVFLVLSALASGKEIIVSRGQQVEIGGSFRIPDIIRRSGARMVEVGTTNKTHLFDYENAITEETALLLRVHTSNFRIIGFTRQVSLPDLAALAKAHNLLVVDDLGSGCLIDLPFSGEIEEPTVQKSMEEGADVVTFSGDKLLGGPQCGLIVGKKELIERIGRHPLARSLRIDKLSLAALEAVLRIYAEGKQWEEIPVLQMLGRTDDKLTETAVRLRELLSRSTAGKFQLKVIDDPSKVGGGALPGLELSGKAVAFYPLSDLTANELQARLRRTTPPVIGRIQDEALLLNVRTIKPEDLAPIKTALQEALEEEER